MSASQPANFNLQEFSDAGLLLLGGRLYTYAYGTTAQKIAYTDPAGTVPHTYTADGTGGQYIALNARGELPAPLYLATGSYDLALKRGDGSTIWTRKADGVENTPNSLAAALAAAAGASLVGFIQAGVGAVLRTAQDKQRERISVEDFGAVGNGVADDTAAIYAAILASIKSGGFGTIHLQAGKRYNFTNLSIDGVIGLTIKGQNGGNVGNLSAGSSGGASMLVCTSTAGDALSFTGVAYHAASITFEDVVLVANTPGYALVFNNVSQINFHRVIVTNAGGTAYNNGNGIRFSNTYYVYADKLYVWKTGTLYSVGAAITIDKGTQPTFLGGEFNFYNCSISSWYSGLVAGNRSITATGSENYANVNYINSEVQGCSEGVVLFYGVISAVVRGCYMEGNLGTSVGVYNKATNVVIADNFFNGFSSGTADIELGQNGSGTQYTQFYNVSIKNNAFFAVNKFGVKSFAGAGSGVTISDNNFVLANAGGVGVSLIEATPGALNSVVEDNEFTGFAAGSAISGAITRGVNNCEYDAAGGLVRAIKNSAIVYPAFVDFTQIRPNDPEITIITNTVAGARYLNGTVATNKYRRQQITLTAASTQNVRLMAADSTTQLALLTPGKGAVMWNDGVNEYASLLA